MKQGDKDMEVNEIEQNIEEDIVTEAGVSLIWE